jgi:hypothetical protein
MNRNMTLMVILASCLFAGNAFCADWKFYGEFTTAPDIEEVLFYDSSSIINTNNSIKLWVKTVLSSDIEKSLENKLVIEKATKKIGDGYNPPITKIHPKATNAAYLEEAANEPSLKSKAEILYQIKCNENKFRKITGTSFNRDGAPDLRFGINKWEGIAPESNADNLARILCGSK